MKTGELPALIAERVQIALHEGCPVLAALTDEFNSLAGYTSARVYVNDPIFPFVHSPNSFGDEPADIGPDALRS
jgi:hypothetical protein